MTSVVRVIATIRSLPGKEVEVAAMMAALAAASRQEAGCVAYEVLQQIASPVEFVTIEQWASEEAMTAHLSGPVVQEAMAKIPGLLATPPDIQSYRLIV